MSIYKIRLKKGDMVKVRVGKDRGKTGKVLSTHPTLNMVTVEGINIVKRHTKPNREHPQGAIADLTKPIHVSKVGILVKEKDVASRISFKTTTDSKTRIFTKTGKEIK